MSKRTTRRVLLIGWDAADWKIASPLMDAGQMPTLSRLVEDGVMGNLATLRPMLSPMLWTSIATGKRPQKHGILGFTEPDPSGGGIRPSTSTTRKVKALWNILGQAGLRSLVVGWFASHPAEPIRGVCISEQFHRATARMDEPWPLAPDAVHPSELASTLAELRVHPAELEAGHLLPFVPRAAEVDQAVDTRLAMLAKLLAETTSINSAATWLLEREPWDFAAVYFDGIDHFCHGFMHYHPPKLDYVDERDFELYRNVVVGAYRYHDMILHRLLELCGDDTTVILCSDHGFHCDQLRPRGLPRQPAGPAVCHRELGIVCLRGPGIKRDERIYGSNLLDIAPTVLALFGLPVGADMDGRVLQQAFTAPLEVETTASWEELEGDCGMHPKDRREDPFEARTAIERLVALGYIESPSVDKEKAVAVCMREARYNLAKAFLDARESEAAIPILNELAIEHPAEPRFALALAEAYFEQQEYQRCRNALDPLLNGNAEQPWALVLLGSLALLEGQCESALSHLRRAEAIDPGLPRLHTRLGETYLRMRRWRDAERNFRRALDIDGDCAAAYDGLALSLLARRRWQPAAEAALTAVGLIHHFPRAHFHLGLALARLGHLHEAAQALTTCLSLQPNNQPAKRLLREVSEGTRR